MNEHGVALVTGLVFLAAASLLAVMAANGMSLQRLQSGHHADRARALENARIAEAAARAWLLSRPNSEREMGCVADCVLPVAIAQPGALPPQPEFESLAWWQAEATHAGLHPDTGEAAGLPGGTGAPLWVIEELHYAQAEAVEEQPVVGGIAWYRILGRGTGKNPGVTAVVEAIVARPWEGEFEIAAYPPAEGLGPFCAQFEGSRPCGVQAWRQRR